MRLADLPPALRPNGDRRRRAARPTLHDFRHSFAVRALLDWYRAGVDVQSRLAWLSTYLGHSEPRYTYHYLSAAPELLAHAARLVDDTRTGWR